MLEYFNKRLLKLSCKKITASKYQVFWGINYTVYSMSTRLKSTRGLKVLLSTVGYGRLPITPCNLKNAGYHGLKLSSPLEVNLIEAGNFTKIVPSGEQTK